MGRERWSGVWILVVACSVAAFGCGGDSGSPLSPFGSRWSGRRSTATIQGQVSSSSSGRGGLATSGGGSGMMVAVVGGSQSGMVDGGGRFTLSNVSPGPVQLHSSPAPGSMRGSTSGGLKRVG